jgi:glycosyltransferase involved in cell wall biosynthesis
MKVLFITRKFPPSKGGLETAAYELSRNLSKLTDIVLIKWGGSNRWLPFILPCFLLRAAWTLSTRSIDVIYLQDGLLAPLGLALKVIFRKSAAITINGLDITYKNRLYQFIVPRCINKLDRVICISNATKDACAIRGIKAEKATVILEGITDEFHIDTDKNILRKALSDKFKIDLSGKKVLISVGRLVERKGIHWFIDNVMPQLKESKCIYLIAGSGMYADKIRGSINRTGLKDVVFMLGAVDNETLRYLYNSADVFIMPNIPVEGDMEGFGIVALEAASCGLPVVAADLEGIKDAINDGENGFLMAPLSVEKYYSVIKKLIEDSKLSEQSGRCAREITLKRFAWENVAESYLSEFETITKQP